MRRPMIAAAALGLLPAVLAAEATDHRPTDNATAARILALDAAGAWADDRYRAAYVAALDPAERGAAIAAIRTAGCVWFSDDLSVYCER
jgi:hypothetical protein